MEGLKTRRVIDRLTEIEIRASGWMERLGLLLLRISIGICFIWFGALKPFHLSPTEALVVKTTPFFPPHIFLHVLAVWEVVIGVCFLFRRTLRVALMLLFAQMGGTLLPLVTLPEVCWTQFPHALTLEGQYIIKNLVIISAALVIGGTLRHRVSGFSRFSSDEFMSLLRRGHWANKQIGERLTVQGDGVDRVSLIYTGSVAIEVDGEKIAVRGSGHFIGEMSLLTGEPATATVTVTEATRVISWQRMELNALFKEHPNLRHGMQAAISQNLIRKLTRNGT